MFIDTSTLVSSISDREMEMGAPFSGKLAISRDIGSIYGLLFFPLSDSKY